MAQVTLKNVQGEQIFSPIIDKNQTGTLISLNTGTTSLGFEYYFTDKSKDPSTYYIFRLGASAKATAGLGPLISNGQLSPGTDITASYTKVRLFAPVVFNHKFFDWLSLDAAYSIDQFKLFKSDTTFSEQIYNQRFRGFKLIASYNMMLGSAMRDYICISVGYIRKNNYSDLTSVDIHDFTQVENTSPEVTRRYGNTVNAKQGLYKEYDSYPLNFSYTYVPFQNRYQSNTKTKSVTTVTYVRTVAQSDTVYKDGIDSEGNHIRVLSVITHRPKIDTVTTITKPEEVKVENPFFKSLRFGYAVYANPNIGINGNSTVTNIGTVLFLASPNKDNILTTRLGLDFQLSDFFDSKHVNNGPFNRIKIGFTTIFSL